MRLWVHEAHWLLGFCSSGSSLNGALVAAAIAGIILLCYLRSDFREQGHCIVEYLGIGIRLAWCYNSPLWIVMGCKQSRMKLSPIISLLREEDVNKIAPLTKKKSADDSPFVLSMDGYTMRAFLESLSPLPPPPRLLPSPLLSADPPTRESYGQNIWLSLSKPSWMACPSQAFNSP